MVFIVLLMASVTSSVGRTLIFYTEVVKRVVVNFLFQVIFIFPLFLGMVMHANEFKTKEKQKLTEIKN